MEFPVTIPFAQLLGLELLEFAGGEARIAMPVAPEHCNSFAVAHGGAIMTLMDVVMAHAARSVNQDSGVVTIEMKTSFMRPGSGRLVGHARLLHRTGSMAFVEATIEDAQGQACAHATGTFRYVKRAQPDGAISTD